MTKVMLAGDWHGNTRWAISCIQNAVENGCDTIYQLGDFGLWPGVEGRSYLEDIAIACQEYGIKLYITPGNHEDYTQIVDPEGPTPPLQTLTDGLGWGIYVMPRGYTWEYGGLKWLSFGGAPSIDFEGRKEGRSWWREEMIRDSDLDRLDGLGRIDIMLTHDAPDGATQAVQSIIDTPPHKSMWTAKGLAYAAEGRMKMNKAVEMVKPRMFAHGHMHVYDARLDPDTGQTWLSLGPDGTQGNAIILDTDGFNDTEWSEDDDSQV